VALAISVSSEIALIASRQRASLDCVDRFCRASLVPDSGSVLLDVHSAINLNCGASCEGKFTRGDGRNRASDILGRAPAVDGVKPSTSSMSKRDRATSVIGVCEADRVGTSHMAIPFGARRSAGEYAMSKATVAGRLSCLPFGGDVEQVAS